MEKITTKEFLKDTHTEFMQDVRTTLHSCFPEASIRDIHKAAYLIGRLEINCSDKIIEAFSEDVTNMIKENLGGKGYDY